MVATRRSRPPQSVGTSGTGAVAAPEHKVQISADLRDTRSAEAIIGYNERGVPR
jgi:hypothetical protein